MTVTRQQRSYETNATQPFSTEPSQRKAMLQTCQGLFARELTDEEAGFWAGFMREYSLAELQFAFDNWNRNGRFFPKPKDIAEQCDVYRMKARQRAGYPECDAECKSRHGRGYGINDVNWLLKRYFADPSQDPNKLLKELDSKREGGAPEWRR